MRLKNGSTGTDLAPMCCKMPGTSERFLLLCTGFSHFWRGGCSCRLDPSQRAPGRVRRERQLRAGAAWAKLASISQTVQGCHPRTPVGQKGCPRTTMALACVGIDGCFGDDVNNDETRGPETTIQAPAGTLGISFGSDDTSNVIIAVRPTSPLAGSVAVGDKLISISGPGRAPFRCGGSTGSEVVGELRAAENTGDRVLTFKKPAAFEVAAPPGALGLIFESHGPRVTALRSWSPLSGQVAVGDVLTSINGELAVAAGDGARCGFGERGRRRSPTAASPSAGEVVLGQ